MTDPNEAVAPLAKLLWWKMLRGKFEMTEAENKTQLWSKLVLQQGNK